MFEMKKESEYANVLRAIAEGHELQWFDSGKKWVSVISNKQILIDIGCGTALPPCEYRIKPCTININGHEVPEPMRVAPEKETRYYAPHVLAEDLYVCWTWHGNSTDNRLLLLGITHKTKEAAITHAKALLSFTEVKG